MKRVTTASRFWAKVTLGPRSDLRPDLGPCWLWTGSAGTTYGRFADENGRQVQAHRWCYEEATGAIPEGLELDHLCMVRLCVRPTHLEPVTHQENVIRAAAARRAGTLSRRP